MKPPAYPIEIDIAIADEAWPDDLEPLAERAILAALAAACPEMTGPASVSLLLTDDARQKALNAQWRGKDAATNVLSFPAIEPFGPLTGLVGDIALARETLEREAAGQGIAFGAHFTHLLVHGLLHCLGYDHMTPGDALVMERLETQILAGLGIADPYAGD